MAGQVCIPALRKERHLKIAGAQDSGKGVRVRGKAGEGAEATPYRASEAS